MKTITATDARTKLFKLLQLIKKTHQHVRVTSKAGSAIIMSEEEYDSMVETMDLLTTPGFREKFTEARKDIEHDNTFSVDEVFGDDV